MPDDGTGWRHLDWSPWLGQPGTAGVLTDYDGTLAAVVEDRDKAAPLPGVPGIVAALAERFALVAVVSGRPVDYLESQLGRRRTSRWLGSTASSGSRTGSTGSWTPLPSGNRP